MDEANVSNNESRNLKKFDLKQSNVILFVCILCFCLLLKLNKQVTIKCGVTPFRYPWNLEFAIQNLELDPYDEEKSRDCLTCYYSPNNVFPNSSPYDVIIVFAYGKLQNIELFIRTLRTTKSKASCVFIMERKAFHINSQRKYFIQKCGIQILTFDFPNDIYNIENKSYLFHLAELFLRSNQANIKRVAIMDLFDTVFQGDPFNGLLPTDSIHIVDEGTLYGDKSYISKTNKKWIFAHDLNFRFTKEQLKIKLWCAGYIEGPSFHMINLLHLYNQVIVNNKTAVDQGGFNYINLTGMIQRAKIPVAPLSFNERVRHSSLFKIRQTFPNVTTMYNSSLIATVLHHYYNSNDKFKISLLNACPRPNSNYTSYLSHCNEEKIAILENSNQTLKTNHTTQELTKS